MRERRDDFATDPVGSGPFELDEHRPGTLTRVTADEDYWGRPTPNVAAVEFRPVEDAPSRVSSLLAGDNLVVENVSPNLVETVRESPDAELRSRPTLSYVYLGMNCNEGPTTDPAVREAVDYAFSMDRAVSEFVEPVGERLYSPVPRPVAETWEFPTGQWRRIPHDKDVDRARRLFDEAGVPADYDWRIVAPPVDEFENLGITVGNGLQEAGFENVTVRRLDWGPFLETYVTGREDDYNAFVAEWAGRPDPDAFTYQLLSRSPEILGATNGTYYGANSRRGRSVSRTLAEARETGDFERRRQLYVDAVTTTLEDRVHVPAYSRSLLYGIRDEVSGFAVHPVEKFQLVIGHNNVSVAT